MSAMIDCPHPHLCGVQQHRRDKNAISTCTQRGNDVQRALASGVRQVLVRSAGMTEQISPGESRFMGVYACTELLESQGVTQGGRIGVDIYQVDLEPESGAGNMQVTWAVPAGDTPPTAHEVVRNIVLEHETTLAHGQDWASWAQMRMMDTDGGRGGDGLNQWVRVHQENDQLRQILGDEYAEVRAAIKAEKAAEKPLFAPVGVRPEAVASMDRVLRSRSLHDQLFARPQDLLVDMIMSEEDVAIDLDDVMAWRAARVGEYHAEQRAEQRALRSLEDDEIDVR